MPPSSAASFLLLRSVAAHSNNRRHIGRATVFSWRDSRQLIFRDISYIARADAADIRVGGSSGRLYAMRVLRRIIPSLLLDLFPAKAVQTKKFGQLAIYVVETCF
jgi:hypothetical protein